MNENGKGKREESGSFHLWRQAYRPKWMSLKTIRQLRNLVVFSVFEVLPESISYNTSTALL